MRPVKTHHSKVTWLWLDCFQNNPTDSCLNNPTDSCQNNLQSVLQYQVIPTCNNSLLRCTTVVTFTLTWDNECKEYKTRFGPNRPAADMEGNGEFDFLVIYEDFWRVFEDFWRICEEFWRFFWGILDNFWPVLEILNFVWKTSNLLSFVTRTSR